MSRAATPQTDDAHTPPANGSWTTRTLLEWTGRFFAERGVESPRTVAEVLLAHVIGCDRTRLYMEVDRPATEAERGRFRALVKRAAGGEPLQYLTGETSFYWRRFRVGPSTLIPQPSTETLVGHVLKAFAVAAPEAEELPVDDHATGTTTAVPEPEPVPVPDPQPARDLLLADIGTGTGCIAVSLAAQLPGSTVVATDILAEALDLARENARRYRVEDRIEFVLGATCEPLAERVRRTGRRFDAICSNPPYVPDHQRDQMDDCVRDHVPASAWSGGPDGLDVIRPLLAAAPALLVPGGHLAIEIADCQRDEVLRIAEATPDLSDVEVLKDYEGYWRVVVGRRRDLGI